jgi:hypothetical protein
MEGKRLATERRALGIRVEDRKLYEVSLDLSKQVRRELGLRFPVKIFVQDPLVAEKHREEGILGIEEIDMDWEPGLANGPTSARVAVVDYNVEKDILADPVAWNEEEKRFMVPDEPDAYQFHQVNVWAIVQNTLAFFEDPYVMGRPIPWGFDGNRLIVVPHAGVKKNAFYDRRSKSLQFYFFGEEEHPVYTCLSHDIVAHETGHAILDGIRPYYYEICSVQTAAFHEFIADLTAILSALRNNSVRHAVAEISEGDIWNGNVITDLAEQFAQEDVARTYGDSQRYYLRSAYNEVTMEGIEGKWVPHDCSLVLTGAMFEILARITKLLMDEHGRSERDALWRATQHLNRMAFRALDFCPPVDIQFLDYARAVIRANELAYPRDTLGYKEILREVFEGRGLTELDPLPPLLSVNLTWKYDITSIAGSRTAAYHFLNDNRGYLDIPQHQDIEVADTYYTDKVVGANRKLPREIVLEYVWREDVVLEGDSFGRFQGEMIPFLCGGTLVFDERGNILYWCKKGGTQTGEFVEEGERRREALLDYVAKLIRVGVIGLSEGEATYGVDLYQPAILGRRVNGALHLEMTSEFLNRGTEMRWME